MLLLLLLLLLRLLAMDNGVPSSLLERVDVVMDGVVTSAGKDGPSIVVVVPASIDGGGDLVHFFLVDDKNVVSMVAILFSFCSVIT